QVDGLGGEVWQGAYVLCRHLEFLASSSPLGSVLELGAGAGLCGLVAALLNAPAVCITDEFVDLAAINAAAFASAFPEAGKRVIVAPLLWGGGSRDNGNVYDLIIGSEILSMRGTHAALLATI
ncbi:unnamed protein product, partial [Phaeothamnion confervicola]